jgi:hypothetical protein
VALLFLHLLKRKEVRRWERTKESKCKKESLFLIPSPQQPTNIQSKGKKNGGNEYLEHHGQHLVEHHLAEEHRGRALERPFLVLMRYVSFKHFNCIALN